MVCSGKKLEWEEIDEVERRIDYVLSFIEPGADDEVTDIRELKEILEAEVKEHLYYDVPCDNVEIIDIRAEAEMLSVKFECDGRKYVAKWRYRWFCTYLAFYSHLEQAEE